MNCLTLSATLFVFVFFCFPIESFLCQQAPATCLLFDLTCYHYTCHIWKASSFTLSQVTHLVGAWQGRPVHVISMTHKCDMVKVGGKPKKKIGGIYNCCGQFTVTAHIMQPLRFLNEMSSYLYLQSLYRILASLAVTTHKQLSWTKYESHANNQKQTPHVHACSMLMIGLSH